MRTKGWSWNLQQLIVVTYSIRAFRRESDEAEIQVVEGRMQVVQVACV